MGRGEFDSGIRSFTFFNQGALKIMSMYYSMAGILMMAFAIPGCSGITLLLGPSDTARQIGTNVTLACIVTNQQTSESVLWKHKPVGSDAFNALTLNENILASPTKYAIQWTYNLTIFNIDVADTGVYRCTAGSNDYDAKLTAVDLPRNVSLEMIGEPVNGETHNLTCSAAHGLPPPEITWLVNGVDMTNQAAVSNVNKSSGYGDVTSYLPLALTEDMNGKGVECVLSYKGWEGAMKATYTLQTIYPGGYANTGTGFFNPSPIIIPGGTTNYTKPQHNKQGGVPSAGVFMIRFLKQSATENINWEIQQYKP